jgi:hypothetical protein
MHVMCLVYLILLEFHALTRVQIMKFLIM